MPRYFLGSMFLILGAFFAPPMQAQGGEQAADVDVEQRVRGWACEPDDLDAASARMLELRDADQQSRTGGGAADFEGDIERRVEVAAIYARGCLQRGEDFHHAALIFQHGNSPEHYYQAWFFASRAVALGESEAAWLIPRAIDRYFLNLGYKQLFGTNTVTPYIWDEDSEESYFCLWPVEDGFSDEGRLAYSMYGIKPVEEKRASVAARLNPDHGLENGECPVAASSPPRGYFSGIW